MPSKAEVVAPVLPAHSIRFVTVADPDVLAIAATEIDISFSTLAEDWVLATAEAETSSTLSMLAGAGETVATAEPEKPIPFVIPASAFVATEEFPLATMNF